MTLVQSVTRMPQYAPAAFASSCTAQANIYKQTSPSPSPKTSIGGLPLRLRRSSNASIASTASISRPRCLAQIRQIEVDIASTAPSSCVLRVQTPTGEAADLRLASGSSQAFVPNVDGCGHGTWSFEVFELVNDGLHSDHRFEKKIVLNGVGSLYFAVNNDFELELQSQEFLALPSSSICSH